MHLIHGHVDITIEDNLFIIRANGPWNVEFFHQLHKELIIHFFHLKSLPYGTLFIPSGETLATKEGLKVHSDFLSMAVPTPIAVVTSELKHKRLAIAQCTSVYEPANLLYGFFETFDEAREWLQRQLASPECNTPRYTRRPMPKQSFSKHGEH